jgi:2-octaprenyl-6-methoxyphenol hydroxylase
MELRTEVLIIGGGLVGGTMACALGRYGVPCVVVDRDDPSTLTDEGYDGRCSAVALACQKVLAGVGLWQHMADQCQPIEHIRVADGQSLLFLHYDHRDVGDEPMGYMAENRHMRRAIYRQLDTLPDVTHLAPHSVVALDRGPDGAVAELEDGRIIRAKLVVAADGRRSPTREAAGIPIHGWDYNQDGIVMTVWHERDHNGTAIEHFLPAGPFAILPLKGGHHSSLVWTERRPLVAELMGLDDATFHAELMKRFGDFLGDVKVVSKRFHYPLSLQFARRYTGRRLALIGDAAHGMHPVAGQGMNFGLRDVAVLAEKIVEAHRLGLDVGTITVLDDYQRLRRFDNMLMLGMTDALVRLFSNDIPPLRLARDVGMAVVNKINPAKKFFMRHAMGEVGALPKLMRGQGL